MRLPLRRQALVGLGIVSAGFGSLAAAVAWGVHGDAGPAHIDATVLLRLDRKTLSGHFGPGDYDRLQTLTLLHRVLSAGSSAVVVAAVLVLVGVALSRRDWFAAAIAVAGPIVAQFGTEVVMKPLVGRTGPRGGEFVFPSGHATAVAAVATAALLILDWDVGRRWAAGAAPLLAGWVIAVGWASVQIHDHYLTDVVAGAAVGIATVLAVVAFAGLLLARVTDAEEPAPEGTGSLHGRAERI